MGDEILVLTSSILKKIFPEDLIARIGGDEFLIVSLGEWDIEKIMDKASLVIKDLKEAYINKTNFIHLSSSIGITTAYNKVIDLDKLIKQSDVALYEAKRRGKSQIYFLPFE